jgi:CheY-like chemotaxis protein
MPRRDIPAIALTGFGMEHDVARSLEAGFTEHLTKPVNFQKLEAVISTLSRG